MGKPARRQALPSIRIRQATTDDRAMILALYEDFDREGLSVGMPPETGIAEWLDALATSPNFIAVERDQVVGHSFLRPEDGTGEVAVYVRREARGRGVGRRLLALAIEEARHLHLGRIWGVTESRNEPMLQLARSLGFEQANDPNLFWLKLEPPSESKLVVTSPPLPQE